MADRGNDAAAFIDAAADRLQLLVVREVPDHPVAAGVVDHRVIVRVDLAGLEGRTQAVHEVLVLVPLPIALVGHRQAMGIYGGVAAQGAHVIDLVTGRFHLPDEMHRLAQPETRGTRQVRILGKAGQHHQHLLAHVPPHSAYCREKGSASHRGEYLACNCAAGRSRRLAASCPTRPAGWSCRGRGTRRSCPSRPSSS
ncbi:hypothetical protein D3C85_1210150 [compost metagenome]